MSFNVLTIKDEEFYKFKEFIEKRIGIKFPETKKSLLESRLALHVKKKGFETFGEYFEHLESSGNHDEFNFFVDKITTHTTYFFRENEQFNFLIDSGIDLLNNNFGSLNPIRLLSLGSSTGEEMYTLALILSELQNESKVNNFAIDGADVSKKALLQAKSGIFDLKHLESLPAKYKKYFNLNKDNIEAKREIRKHLRFFLLNGAKKNQKFPNGYHIIFCRNTLIYFNKTMQQNFIDNIYNALIPGGLMFLGHSEALHGIDHRFKRLKSSIYIKGVNND